MPILFLPAAREEFLAQVSRYEDEVPGLGRRFAARMEATAVLAATYPNVGAPSPADTRRAFVRGFPYSIVYRQLPEGILIVAVPHHSRAPGYWSDG